MQAVFIQPGREINYTPTSADVAAGAVVVQQNLVGIAKVAIPRNTLGAISVSGVFDVEQNAEAITAGSAVYWNASGTPVGGTATGCATATASSNKFMGFALATTVNTDLTVRVRVCSSEGLVATTLTATSITGTASTLPIAGLAAAQGGTATLTGGASSTAANAGGAVALTGGVGGAEGAGGAATVAGGAGGSTSGTGGEVTVAGGAGSNGNANGGALTLRGGAKHGSGTHGAVSIGATNTASVTIAAASVATIIGGPVTASVGASTAADGSDNTNATALPAGTASVYPTTAADGAKGVIIHANDKVTGRMLLIGNGVGDQILKVYPPSGGNINGLGANAAFSSVSGKGVIIVCLDSGANTWLAW